MGFSVLVEDDVNALAAFEAVDEFVGALDDFLGGLGGAEEALKVFGRDRRNRAKVGSLGDAFHVENGTGAGIGGNLDGVLNGGGRFGFGWRATEEAAEEAWLNFGWLPESARAKFLFAEFLEGGLDVLFKGDSVGPEVAAHKC